MRVAREEGVLAIDTNVLSTARSSRESVRNTPIVRNGNSLRTRNTAERTGHHQSACLISAITLPIR